MGRKKLGFRTVMGFLGALLVVLVTVGQEVDRSIRERETVAALELRIVSMAEETVEKQRKIAKWYNWSLERGNYVSERVYQSILNLGEGQMGLLEVPKLELRLPITHGIGGVAGHDPATALPIGGREDQTVLYIQKAVPWQEGMALRTNLPGTGQEWMVESIQVMPRGWPVDHPPGSALLTLVYDRGNIRTLIRCRPWEGSHWEPLDESNLGGKALFWGSVPLFLIPALCALGKILFFIHPGKRKKGIIF